MSFLADADHKICEFFDNAFFGKKPTPANVIAQNQAHLFTQFDPSELTLDRIRLVEAHTGIPAEDAKNTLLKKMAKWGAF